MDIKRFFVGRLFLLILIFPFQSFSQRDSLPNYKVVIGGYLYNVKYAKSYTSSDLVPRVAKADTFWQVKLKTNLVCDTLPTHAYFHNPTAPDSVKFMISCYDYITVTDTISAKNILDIEKLFNNEVYVLKDSRRIDPISIDIYLVDINHSKLHLNSKIFDKNKIERFMKDSDEVIYCQILDVEFYDEQKLITIGIYVAFRLRRQS